MDVVEACWLEEAGVLSVSVVTTIDCDVKGAPCCVPFVIDVDNPEDVARAAVWVDP